MAGDRVVVVGAGIGGLAAAALLAARGLHVTVVEKEAASGGKVRRVPVGESLVDGGPTVFTLRDVFDEIFEAAGTSLDDEVAVRRAEVIARHAWSERERLDLFADPGASEAAIGEFAGAEAVRGYRAFRAEAKRIHEALDRPFMRAGQTNPLGLGWRMGLSGLRDYATLRPYSSLWRALGGYFRDPRLRQLFGRYTTYCGSSPFKAPATLMLIAHVEAMGVWLIEGGMSALAEALERVARRHGVEFRHGALVDGIVVEKGRAAAVRLATGERIAADAVIANCDPASLAAGRLGEGARRAVKPVPPGQRSLSAFTWLMETRTSGFPLDRHNVFFSNDYPAEFAALHAGRVPEAPTAYVCALDRPNEILPGTGRGTAREASGGGAPSLNRSDAGGVGPLRLGFAEPPPRSGEEFERLQIIVNAPANGDTHLYDSGEIERCGRHMRARLAACGLDLEPTAAPVVATPNSFEGLFPSTGGALYGRASHGWAASFLRQSARTRIPGLYCAGGSTHPGAGVPMAALSAQAAVHTLLKDRASTARSRPAAMPGGMSTRSRTAANSG